MATLAIFRPRRIVKCVYLLRHSGITRVVVDAGEKRSHFRRSRSEPQHHRGNIQRETPVVEDAVRTLQQFLNCV
jgi:hypothetical protein